MLPVQAVVLAWVTVPPAFLGFIAAFVIQIRFQQGAGGAGLMGFAELVGGIIQIGVGGGVRVWRFVFGRGCRNGRSRNFLFALPCRF